MSHRQRCLEHVNLWGEAGDCPSHLDVWSVHRLPPRRRRTQVSMSNKSHLMPNAPPPPVAWTMFSIGLTLVSKPWASQCVQCTRLPRKAMKKCLVHSTGSSQRCPWLSPILHYGAIANYRCGSFPIATHIVCDTRSRADFTIVSQIAHLSGT